MEDSINKNLDFKLIIFITLLGAWWGLLNYYTTIKTESPYQAVSFIVMFISFFIFYPMVRLGLMLIYISLYQVLDEEKMKNEVEEKYNKNSKIFYRWWALAFVVAPIWLFITIFLNSLWYVSLFFILVYGFIMLKYYFKGIFGFEDIEKYYKNCIWLFVLYLIFFSISQYLVKILK